MVRTFLLADVRGYTQYTREHGDEAASQLARRLAALVGSTVPEFGGELLEVRGDETLCVFVSARQALRAAVEVQRRLRVPVEGEPFPVGVGMGLDAGEAVPTDGGYRGAALNMAGRLVAIAGPGEIRATERLVELTGQVEGLRWGEAKRVRLKGLERPERIVSVESVAPLPPPAMPATPPARRGRILLGAGVAVLVAAVVAVVLGRTLASSSGVDVKPFSIAVIDTHTGKVLADYPIPVGKVPAPLIFSDGALWTYNQGQGDLIRVDPRNGTYQTRGIGVVNPTDLAVGGGFEWIADGVGNRLYRYQWGSNAAPDAIALPKITINFLGGQRPSLSGQVTFHRGEVWATAQGDHWPATIVAYNASSLQRKGLYRLNPYDRQIGDLESGPAGVWMENRIGLGSGGEKAGLVPLDPRPGKPYYVSQGGYLQQGVVVTRSGIWITGGGAKGNALTVEELDAAPPHQITPIVTPYTATAIAAGPAGIWAASTQPGSVFQLHASTDSASRPIMLSEYVTGLAVGRDRVWALIQNKKVEVGATY
jgi:class 3 adenylate cyclase